MLSRRLIALLVVLVAVAAVGVASLIHHDSTKNAQKRAAQALAAYDVAEAKFAASALPSWLTSLPAHPSEFDTCTQGLCGNSPENPLALLGPMRAYLGGVTKVFPRPCSAYLETHTAHLCPVSVYGRRDGRYALAIAFRLLHQTRSDRLPAGAVRVGRSRHGLSAYFLGSLVTISLLSPADATDVGRLLNSRAHAAG